MIGRGRDMTAEQRRTLSSMRQAGEAVNRVALQMNISRMTVSRVWQIRQSAQGTHGGIWLAVVPKSIYIYTLLVLSLGGIYALWSCVLRRPYLDVQRRPHSEKTRYWNVLCSNTDSTPWEQYECIMSAATPPQNVGCERCLITVRRRIRSSLCTVESLEESHWLVQTTDTL